MDATSLNLTGLDMNMRQHPLRYWIAVSLALTACATPTPQSFDVLNSGPQTSLRANSSQAAVITDQSEFTELFDRVAANKRPPDVPKIDFSKDIVIYVSRDPKPSAGYGLKVRSVTCAGSVMSVVLKEIDPQGIAGQAQVITQPYVVLATARCPKLAQVEISGADLASPRPIPVAPAKK